MLESDLKRRFLEKLRERLVGTDIDIYVTTSRSKPDIALLGSPKWATLEFKKDREASHQPNQNYHVYRMNQKSYSRFVYPDNEEEILDELEELFNH